MKNKDKVNRACLVFMEKESNTTVLVDFLLQSQGQQVQSLKENFVFNISWGLI